MDPHWHTAGDELAGPRPLTTRTRGTTALTPREAQGPGSRQQEELRSNSGMKALKRRTFIRLGSRRVTSVIKR